MARPTWSPFVFFMGCWPLVALKLSIAAPQKEKAAFGDDVIEVSVNALAKADQLEVEEIPDKKTIRSIAIAPPTAAPIPEKATEIVSHHWKGGFGKAKGRRTHHGPS